MDYGCRGQYLKSARVHENHLLSCDGIFLPVLGLRFAMRRTNRSRALWRRITGPPGAILVFAIVFAYGLFFYMRGDLDSAAAMEATGLVPYDSYNYAAIGEHGVEIDFSFFQILAGALNWGGLPFLYAFFQQLNDSGGLFFVAVNSIAFCVSVKATHGLFEIRGLAKYWMPLLVLFCSPFVWGWVLGPNKELLVGGAIAVLVLLAERKQYSSILCIAVIIGLVKIQLLLAVILFLVFRRVPYREVVALVFLSLLLPLVLPFYSHFNIDQFVTNAPEEVRSAPIMAWLEQLASTPFGFIIAAPLRLLLNLFAGLRPDRILAGSLFGEIIAPLTSFVLGLLCLVFVLSRRKARLVACYRRYPDGGFLVYSFALVLSIVPFLQPRYFWWLIPYLIYIAVSRNLRFPAIEPYNAENTRRTPRTLADGGQRTFQDVRSQH